MTNDIATRPTATMTFAADKGEQRSLVARALATVQARFAHAERHPRNWAEIERRLLAECERPGFAEAALYEKPQGGQKITGLSVRFAEAVLRYAGNMAIETAIVYDDDNERHVKVSCIDYESNSATDKTIVLRKTVERRNAKGREVLEQRTNSSGQAIFVVRATEDEMLQKQWQQEGKIRRSAILQMTPGDIQDSCRDKLQRTRAALLKNNFEATKAKVFAWLEALGVSEEELNEYLGHASTNITPKDVEGLRNLRARIDEGDTTWLDALEEKRELRTLDVRAEEKPKEIDPVAAKVLEAARGRPTPEPETQAPTTTEMWARAVKVAGADRAKALYEQHVSQSRDPDKAAAELVEKLELGASMTVFIDRAEKAGITEAQLKKYREAAATPETQTLAKLRTQEKALRELVG